MTVLHTRLGEVLQLADPHTPALMLQAAFVAHLKKRALDPFDSISRRSKFGGHVQYTWIMLMTPKGTPLESANLFAWAQNVVYRTIK